MDFRMEWKGPDWNKIKKEMLAGAKADAHRRARRALGGKRCPDHGHPIRWVVETGPVSSTEDRLGRVEGCCEKAVRIGGDALRRAGVITS